ncbi:sulfite exporter TauE/SafE family protein [Salinisphaera sp. T31B1]|uniref:sulfite exporter TauE/SafE family protein n=1 Tax=Salinisphaera sp. T31B1 TaxID=727963 RepID=UPI00333E5D32
MPEASPLTLTVVAALLVIYLFGGFIKGAAAFGQPMLTIPLSSFLLPVPTAIAISIAPVMVANVVQLIQNRRVFRATFVYWPFYVTLVLAMILGLVVLSNVGHEGLLTLIGTLILVFVAVQASGWQPAIATPLRVRAQLVTGAASGLLAGMTSFVSFPSIPVFVAARMQRDVFAMVIGVMFLLASAILSTGLTVLGVYGRAEVLTAVACIAPSAGGQMLGQYVRDRLPERRLRAIVFSMLAAMGASLILRGLW